MPRTPIKRESPSSKSLKHSQLRDTTRTPTSGRHIYSLNAPSSGGSTPASSPARVVNIVSSPGPMRSAEDELDELPYALPPGPYSTVKPDYSYAALIGQAILSSPRHRLTLQDIYEWISTVYPHYRRDEQTWMNSVRHALSTMAVFRKVPRIRAEGKSLWAIWDSDIACFANGCFKKSLCADMNKPESISKSSRKRASLDETLATKPKKRKTSISKDADATQGTTAPLATMLPAISLPPLFPSFHPNPHHQPYYQAYPQHPPVEYLFPPLPPTSNYHQIVLNAVVSACATTGSRSASVEPHESSQSASEANESNHAHRERERSPKTLPSLSSIPALTPNCSSSSSPPLLSEPLAPERQLPDLGDAFELLDEEAFSRDEDNELPCSADELEPSPTVLPAVTREKSKDTMKLNQMSTIKSRRKVCPVDLRKLSRSLTNIVVDVKRMAALPMPSSPTLDRIASKQKAKEASRSRTSTPPLVPVRKLSPPVTPPPRIATPPRARASTSALQISPFRTPISHMGLHMSPSPSLAHYKSNLDPPPVAIFTPRTRLLNMSSEDSEALPIESEILRTPSRTSSRKRTTASALDTSPHAPVTPRRLFSVPTQHSPFRTPSSRLLDPHDPAGLLDDEFHRMSSQLFSQGSPSGFLGKMGGLLYESPNFPSPGRLERYWR